MVPFHLMPGLTTLSDSRCIRYVSSFTFITHIFYSSPSSPQFILVPYYAWRSTHHAHHKATNSIERDENYLPRTRSDYQLPSENIALVSDYHEIFEETPIYTLTRMVFMQLLGWQYYLMTNIMGNPSYPEGTNVRWPLFCSYHLPYLRGLALQHFNPSSTLFKPHERNGIIASNFGLGFVALILSRWTLEIGISNFIKFYFIPYLVCPICPNSTSALVLITFHQLANHWIVMLTYLHHSDPTIAHFRRKEWTFLRGAVATVDRPLLGWAGRFFLHNVSHDHVCGTRLSIMLAY